MSVGRRVCHTLIDAAAEMRRYANLLAEFEELTPAHDTELLAADLLDRASRLESLVPRILGFEGERMLQLPPEVTA